MKQILSIADFATILNLVKQELQALESRCYTLLPYGLTKKEIDKEVERRKNEMKESFYYKSLIQLKESLENLNVEVETADVEIKEK